jgi:DNA-binding IclR family transcriptional regulator
METEKPAKQTDYTGHVPAVDQAARILLCLAKNKSSRMNLTEICSTVGIHKSKGYAILNTLMKFGFVRKEPEGKTYSLGLGLISLSRRVLDGLNFGEAAGPFLERLARKTHSTALLGLLDEDEYAFIVAKQEADHNIGLTTRVGHRFVVTEGAAGKAIFAFLPAHERERLLSGKPLRFHGSEAAFDPARLDKELRQCRRTGYAVDLGENFPGINIVAAPAFDSHGALLGSIFILGTFPEKLAGEYGPLVAETAKEFSIFLGADVERIYGEAGKTGY